ncbi:hypothetical protein Goklo_012351 [Gossypium klotzschianum]|uniref:RNase H type-1 domain-containing protein n=2 Tax=Gossypium TaxID=3633 RepID=A0A7J8VBX8_9ROSI|nr:hypothetical protein [Gossypium klotzschianum]
MFSKESNLVPARLSNANGVVNVEYGSTALGGVLRDYGGKWILGYNRRFDRVLIQTDSIEAVKAIQMFTKTSLDFALIRRIQQLLMEVGNWLL